MNDHEREQLIHLQGRIIALELATRVLLYDIVSRHDRPLATARAMKKTALGSAQNLSREIGEYNDAICEQAADAMRTGYDQLIVRVQEAQRYGHIPPDRE